MAADYTELKRRIEERMRALNIDNNSDLAKILSRKMNSEEVPASNVHNWGNRGSIPVKYIFALANVLDCSPEWLSNGKIQYLNMPSQKGRNQISIPIFKEKGESMEKATISDNLTVDKRWFFDVAGIEYRESFRIIRASGDSMAPTINSGDMVLIDQTKLPQGDGLYYVKHGENREIKRVSFLGDAVHLISDNARHPPKTMLLSDIEIAGHAKFVFNGKRV